MLRVAFAGAICLAAAFALGAGRLHWPALAAGGCVLVGAICFWAWRWRKTRPDADNVWLDDEGLHWRDGSATGRLPRRQVEAFRIGLDPDTVRAIPALTLILVGGFESQPVELYAPAAPATVRNFLANRWQLAEIEPHTARGRELLYRALEASLVEAASNGKPAEHSIAAEHSNAAEHSDAACLLLDALIPPEPEEHGRWIVFRLPSAQTISFDPGGCGFHVASAGAGEALTLEQLVEHVERSVLPADREQREQLLAEADRAASHWRARGETGDVQLAGFRWHDDGAAHCWRFTGSHSPLLALAQQLEKFADRHAPPPPGARPVLERIGGLYHGITIEVNRYDGIAGDVLCATPEKLREIAADLRSALKGAAPGERVEVPVFLAGERWTLTFVVEK